jgi:LmbE family N-acetylglucosaminyl deacetylase
MKKCDILIFAPHPDDEVLSCGGLIYNEVRKGKRVKIVVVTNGEASMDGTELYYGHKPDTQEFIDIGYVRQKESISAMKILGLETNDIIFLGYPNDGLMDILSSDVFSKDNPYKSKFTNFDRVAYKDSYNMGAPFCKESYFDDIKSIFKEYKPRTIYLPHPLDSHLDHRACGRFIYEATKKFDRSISVWAYFISWSKQQSPKRLLIYKLTGQLKEKQLDEGAKKMKERCMRQHKSQMYLYKDLAFHNDLERFWKLEHGIRAKIAKKLIPSLRY